MIDLNIKSTGHLAKRVLAGMVERHSGRVLFMAIGSVRCARTAWGFEAPMAGKDGVVAASFKNKLFVVAGEIAPETAASMHRKQAEQQ